MLVGRIDWPACAFLHCFDGDGLIGTDRFRQRLVTCPAWLPLVLLSLCMSRCCAPAAVLLNGVDVRQLQQDSLRGAVAVVPQVGDQSGGWAEGTGGCRCDVSEGRQMRAVLALVRSCCRRQTRRGWERPWGPHALTDAGER